MAKTSTERKTTSSRQGAGHGGRYWRGRAGAGDCPAIAAATRSLAAAARHRRRPASGGGRRTVPDQADGRRGGDRRRRHLHRRPRQARGGAALPPRRRVELARGADDAARQRPLAGAASRSRNSAATSTRSRAGSTASAAGGTSSRRSSAPGRTSRASCSKARRSSARRSTGAGDAADRRHAGGRSPRRSATRPIAQPATRGCGPRRRGRQTTMARYADRSAATRYGRDLHGRRRARARAIRRVVRDVPALGRDRIRRRAGRSRTPRRSCPTSPRWASTCSTCRRSIRSAAASARGRTTRSSPARTTSAARGRSAAEAGGHDAVEPALGTLEDFDRFVAEAARLGLEIALDLAYQASPDHPYVQEHPGVVPPAPGRHDQVRREPAEEVPGHLPDQLRVARTGKRSGRS